MRDQCLVRVEFELEFVAQERGQLVFDLFGFGFRSDETQKMIVGVAGAVRVKIFEAGFSGIH
jgi:hypothetical protein